MIQPTGTGVQNTVSAGGAISYPAAELFKNENREEIDMFMDNSGKTNDENDYAITKKVRGGEISLKIDNSGNSFFENDFHVTADTPEGKVDFTIDNSGQSKYEGDFRFSGFDINGDFNIFADNRGKSIHENDYHITGTAYGKKIDILIDNQGKTAQENDFKISGSAPEGFLTSPLFSNIVLPCITVIPVLPVLYKLDKNDENITTSAFVGPVLLNLGMSITGAIEREIEDRARQRRELEERLKLSNSPYIADTEQQVIIDGVKLSKKDCGSPA